MTAARSARHWSTVRQTRTGCDPATADELTELAAEECAADVAREVECWDPATDGPWDDSGLAGLYETAAFHRGAM